MLRWKQKLPRNLRQARRRRCPNEKLYAERFPEFDLLRIWSGPADSSTVVRFVPQVRTHDESRIIPLWVDNREAYLWKKEDQ